MTVGEQPDSNRTIVHLINYSGHQERSFHEPLEIRDIRLALPGVTNRRRVYSTQLGETLPVSTTDGVLSFTLPRLTLFDMVVLE